MNEQNENYALIDGRQLDRLVDGELSDEDRRQLLETLERQPDKWRDCACAFLESQELGTAFTDLVGGAAFPGTLTESIDVPHDGYRATDAVHGRQAGRAWWVGLAACLLLGFAVGRFIDLMNQSESPSQERAPLLVSNQGDVDYDPSLADPINSLVVETSPRNRGQLLIESGRPSVVSAEIETILDHLGHRVERRHVYMPVLSHDGRQGVIPVEQVDFVPVGSETY